MTKNKSTQYGWAAQKITSPGSAGRPERAGRESMENENLDRLSEAFEALKEIRKLADEIKPGASGLNKVRKDLLRLRSKVGAAILMTLQGEHPDYAPTVRVEHPDGRKMT